MKKITFYSFKKSLLTMAAVMGCVSLSYGQEAVEASYDDFGKPTAGTTGNKRWQTKGEVLNAVNVAEESPLTFTPEGSKDYQAWDNSDNPILVYPGGATFDLKVTYDTEGWGSLTVFLLKSGVTPSAADKIFGTYEGDWASGANTNNLYNSISAAAEEGVTVSVNDRVVTFPITIPEDMTEGQMVVVRFIICKDDASESKTYDGEPNSTTAYELTYCDYVVKVVPKKDYGSVTLDPVAPEQGSAEIQSYDEATSSWVSASDLSRVEFGTELRVAVSPAEGYSVSSVMKNATALTASEEDGYFYFTVDEESIAILVSFQVASSIDRVESQNVYYNAGEAVLYTADAQRVEIFDLSGRVVMRAADVASVDVSTLNGGVYIAVVDGKVVKFVK
ncbi:T9SS type A sorting domain-containing protein [Barnesiella viscericola]|uniref:T9SS type A sorting domain-containing protein n=1 Tax=Barnesiella viscericola TaxID=397865 RepID=UPI0032078823